MTTSETTIHKLLTKVFVDICIDHGIFVDKVVIDWIDVTKMGFTPEKMIREVQITSTTIP